MWLFFFLTYLFNMAGTILSKQFGVTNNVWYVAGAIISTAFASLTWSFVMKKGAELSSITPIMSVALIISVVLTGFIGYGEPVTWNKIAGVVLGIVAIILIIK